MSDKLPLSVSGLVGRWPGSWWRIGDLQVNYRRGHVFVKEQKLFLTMRQYQVLLLLLAGPVTTADLIRDLWMGYAAKQNAWGVISGLRRKLAISDVTISRPRVDRPAYELVLREEQTK